MAQVTTPPLTILDVGSGDSWFATQLLADLPPGAIIDCWDANYTDADLSESIDSRIRRCATPPAETYPLVMALDVFEHVKDVEEFVRDEVACRVAPGGLLVASVPAHQCLFTRHDEALGHFRRYSRADLRSLLAPSFTIVTEGSLFATLLAPRATQKLREKVFSLRAPEVHVDSAWTHGPAITGVVTAALNADARSALALRRLRVRLPGLSEWAVCRPDSDQ